jgi:hypothetical protein
VWRLRSAFTEYASLTHWRSPLDIGNGVHVEIRTVVPTVVGVHAPETIFIVIASYNFLCSVIDRRLNGGFSPGVFRVVGGLNVADFPLDRPLPRRKVSL